MSKIVKNSFFKTSIFCLLISFFIILICSKCSILYAFNDWVDINSFFTAGKGIFNGKVLYKDLFEQKGPTLYLLYGIGYLISNKSFTGIFILEVISYSIYLFYCGKISDLFLNKKNKYIIIPIVGVLTATCRCFVQGGSAEEFCLPMFEYTLFTFLDLIVNNKISLNRIFINGIVAGIIFTTKFTLLGLWFGFMVSLLLKKLLNKEIKEIFKYSFIFLIGMFLPFLLWITYFIIVHGVTDFISVYFIFNLTSYGVKSNSIITQITGCFTSFYMELLKNGLPIFIIFNIIFTFISKNIKNGIDKVGIYITIICTILFTYIGGLYFDYYLLIIIPWCCLGIIEIISDLDNVIEKALHHTRLAKIIYVVFIICLSIVCYNGANYKEDLKLKKTDLFQYEFAEIINKEVDKTVLNYGALDFGLYTTANIVPNVKYFHMLNVPYENYPYIVDAHIKYVQDTVTNFILTRSSIDGEVDSGLLNNYEIISIKTQEYEHNYFKYYLLKRKVVDNDE